MAIGAAYHPGSSNTYVKNHKASGYLVTQYSRNPKDFALAKYIQYKTVTQDSGYYLRMTAEQSARLVGGSTDEFIWPDGAPRPVNNDGTETFAWADYRTKRYTFPFVLGEKAQKQAGWDVKGVEVSNHAQQAMTARTRRVHEALQSSGNWASGHTLDVASIPGNLGRWDMSTTSRGDIKRSINYAVRQIMLATNSVVTSKEDMRLVMSPTAAQKIGESQELINSVIQSQDGLKHFKGDGVEYGDLGIPKMLYGIEVVVENAVMVTSRRGAASATKSFICSDDEVYLLSRPGGLTAKSGGPSYSSMMLFVYEDMTVEEKREDDNRRINGYVTIDDGAEMVAPSSCFRFTDVLT